MSQGTSKLTILVASADLSSPDVLKFISQFADLEWFYCTRIEIEPVIVFPGTENMKVLFHISLFVGNEGDADFIRGSFKGHLLGHWGWGEKFTIVPQKEEQKTT